MLVGRRGVTLVTGAFLDILDHGSPRLGRRGWRVLDVPGPLVDVDTLQVAVPEPPAFLDPRGLAEIDRRFPRRRSERRVRPGRYEVSHLLAVGGFGSNDSAADPATTREALLAMLVGPGDASTSPDHVRVVERLADRVPPSWIAGLDDRELLGALEHLVG